MLVSVLMSVYHGDNSDHLERAITSIISDQLLPPDQVVLVIDGPISLSLEVCIEKCIKSYNSLEVYRKSNNEGLASALNYGLNFCIGDVIARMDADDISRPNRLSLQINFLLKNQDIGVVGGFIEEFGLEMNNRKIYYPEKDKQLKEIMKFRSPFAHPTVVVRKAILLKHKYNEHFMNSQDIELWFRLRDDNIKFANVNEVVLDYRISEDFFKRRSYQKAFNELTIYLSGIYRNEGLTLSLIFPLIRFCFRLLPQWISRRTYKLRESAFNRTT